MKTQNINKSLISKINFKKTLLWTLAIVPMILIPVLAVAFGGTVETVSVFSNEALTDGISILVDPIQMPDGTWQYPPEYTDPNYVSTGKGLAVIGGGLAAMGMLGAGIGQGYAAGKATEAVGRNPEAESKIRSMFLIGAAIAESSALYGFVIAIIAIFLI